MRVSIVLTVFNKARFLRRALDSIVTQDYPDIELIVVDPGSTDGSRDIIDEYRAHIDVLILEPDRGQGDGTNKGFARATGEVYVCAQGDDLFLPGAIARGVRALQEHPEADWAYGHGYIIDGDGRAVKRAISTPMSRWRIVYRSGYAMHQSTFYRAAAWHDVGGMATDTIWVDADLMYRLVKAGKRSHRINAYLSAFTMDPSGQVGSGLHTATLDALYLSWLRDYRGRDPDWTDRIHFMLARLERLLDPPSVAARLADVVRPPRYAAPPA